MEPFVRACLHICGAGQGFQLPSPTGSLRALAASYLRGFLIRKSSRWVSLAEAGVALALEGVVTQLR
jgi:hypothetical protein